MKRKRLILKIGGRRTVATVPIRTIRKEAIELADFLFENVR